MPRADTTLKSSLREIWPVYLAAPAVLTGIQVLLPALPELQSRLDLGDSEIALITSLYLLPSVVAAVPAGLLADRIERRTVLTAALLIFGLGGLYVTLNPTAFVPMLIVRAIQGAASATVLSLTITIIGDSVTGPPQLLAQAYRGIALKIGDGFWPLAGGVLVGVAWWAPFATQIIALPVALITWFGLAGMPKQKLAKRQGKLKELRSSLMSLPIIVLQLSGFLRFFFKLALITYLPVLAISQGTASAVEIGVVLAASAVAAMISSPITGWLVVRIDASRLAAICLLVIAASFVMLASLPHLEALATAAIVFGLADGIYGVIITATTTQVIPAHMRAAFVGFSTSIRNFGKFAAPTFIGLLVLVVTIQTAFFAVAGVAAVAIASAWPMQRLDDLLLAGPKTAATVIDV